MNARPTLTPRTIPVRVDGKFRKRGWSDQEHALLKATAPQGINALRRLFPGRGDHAIRGQARKLNVRIPRTTFRCDWQRGKLPIPKHCHPLVAEIYREINAQRAYLYEVCERAGIARAAVSKWGHSRNPHIVGLEAIANVLGLELVLVPKKSRRSRHVQDR